jgi:Fanconi-associated nuclease 1
MIPNSKHAETRILTTIFALIFWDIIFSRVPGAFETKFQACPLDMFEDSFYRARKTLFEHRLKEIEDGKAKEYLKRYDDRYRPERTWCIGLRWDAFEQTQLLEIIEVPFMSVYRVT